MIEDTRTPTPQEQAIYLERAHKMRAEAVRQSMSSAVQFVRSLFSRNDTNTNSHKAA